MTRTSLLIKQGGSEHDQNVAFNKSGEAVSMTRTYLLIKQGGSEHVQNVASNKAGRQ